MAFDYAEMQAVADELISEFGQTGTVTRITAPDPITGGDGTEDDYDATLVPMAYSAREIDGTVIKVGDVQIYISAIGLAITPTVGDLVSVNGATYRIERADPNRYDGATDVVHIVQGRIGG
jgi:hypothetical protein